MRLWIGPDDEIIDLDVDYESHSLAVANEPDRFGLLAGPVRQHMEDIADPDGDRDFDYDTVIVMAETKGWVRLSRDAMKGSAAVSASDPAHARRALRKLLRDAPGFVSVDLEIERFEGNAVIRSMRMLGPEETLAFVRHGKLPDTDAYSTPVAEPLLLAALVEPVPSMAR